MKNVADIYPLTAAQAGILYQVLRDDDPELYFEQYRADLRGDITAEQLHAAWTTLIERHPALRTIIVWKGLDEPRQVVREHVELDFVAHDFRSDTAAGAQDAIDELAAAGRRAGIALTSAPLMTVRVVHLDADRWHLIWNFHHIVVDGWSVGIVVDELLALLSGEQLAAAAPGFRNHLEFIGREEADLAPFAERFADVDDRTALDLPGGSGVGWFDRKRIDVTGEACLGARVAMAARRRRVTPNTLVQAAWALTVAHHADRDDVVFGVTMSGRDPRVDGVDDIVGMFLSTLPMRTQLTDDPLEDWLHSIQDQQFELLAAQHVGLSDVIAQSSLPRGTELFDTVLIMENWPDRQRERPVTIEARHVVEQSHYGITAMVHVGEDVGLVLLVDGSRIGDEAAATLGEHFLEMLRRLSSDDPRPAALVEPTTAASRRRQLNEWNPAAVPEPAITIAEAWAHVVAEAGDSVAATIGDRELTFAQLDERSSAVARALVADGVEPGEPVGISLQRSFESLVALLGIVRSGGIYVPLDPNYPPDRLALIVDDSGARRVVVHEPTAHLFGDVATSDVDDLEAEGRRSNDVELPDRQPTDPLYITYTSGSTGRPKGVLGHHLGVISRCRWQWETYPFDPAEVMLQRVTLNFVDHIPELWASLLAGVSMVLVPDAEAADGRSLVELVKRHRPRRLSLTPSFVETLLDAIPDLESDFASLEMLGLSGEGVSSELVSRLRRELPDVIPINLYGMSEVTVDAAVHDGSEDVSTSSSFPIGRPIRNQRMYVLDRHGRLVPEGAIGRLHVSGVGVTHGYWRQPELTAERFSPDPFVADPVTTPAQMYDTGDLGRWLPGGILEYHGRDDDQVKIRGSRLELGDVEGTLAGVTGVGAVVAAAIEGATSADRTLVAFVRPVDGEDPSVVLDRVRAHAAAALPAFMVPSVVEAIDAVPTTPNGKADRRALTAGWSRVTTGEVVGPADETEAAMLQLWSELLGPGIGMTSDFFDVGGHSLSALRLTSRISKAFGVDLSLADVMAGPTPRALSLLVDAGGSAATMQHIVTLGGAGLAAQPVFCVHGAGGNVMRFTELARLIGEERPFHALQARGADGTTRPHTSITQMAQAYIAEMLTIQPRGSYLLAGYSSGGVVAYEMARLLLADGLEVDAVVLLDTYHPAVLPRQRSNFERARDLATLSPAKALQRVVDFQRERADRRAWDVVKESAGDEVRPELRFARLNEAIGSAYRSYEPEPIDVRLALIAADDVNPAFSHVSQLRGWDAVSPSMTRYPVAADHHDLLEGAKVAATAAAMRSAIASD